MNLQIELTMILKILLILVLKVKFLITMNKLTVEIT